jgi:tetratricopeptide (TPR) repeat protein
MCILKTVGVASAAISAIALGMLIAPATPARAQSKTPTTPTAPSSAGKSLPGSTPSTPGPTMPPMFLSGRVVIDDGTALPEPVTIERVCNGVPRPEAHTDAKGHFSFQLGQNRYEFADASYAAPMNLGSPNQPSMSSSSPLSGSNLPSGGPMQINSDNNFYMAGCEIRAALSGYRSDAVQLATRRYLDNPDVGTIVLHRMGNVEGLTTSAVSLGAPKDARKSYDKGLEALKKDNIDEAQKSFLKAVQGYPHFATAWYELGKVYEKRDHWADARKAYDEALSSDPKYASPLERVYLLDMRDGNWQAVADNSAKLLKLNPYEFPAAYMHNAMANFQIKQWDPAEKSVREGIKLDPANRYPRLNYILALLLAQKQDFPGCAEYLKKYIKLAPDAKDIETAKSQLEETEKYVQALVGTQKKQ